MKRSNATVFGGAFPHVRGGGTSLPSQEYRRGTGSSLTGLVSRMWTVGCFGEVEVPETAEVCPCEETVGADFVCAPLVVEPAGAPEPADVLAGEPDSPQPTKAKPAISAPQTTVLVGDFQRMAAPGDRRRSDRPRQADHHDVSHSTVAARVKAGQFALFRAARFHRHVAGRWHSSPTGHPRSPTLRKTTGAHGAQVLAKCRSVANRPLPLPVLDSSRPVKNARPEALVAAFCESSQSSGSGKSQATNKPDAHRAKAALSH